MANYLTIGEVSEQLGVEPHTIRFWEKEFEHLHPVKRRGNRRFYSEEDVETLSEIRKLLHSEGYTIKGARQAMKQKKETNNPEKAAQENIQMNIFDIIPEPTEAQRKMLTALLADLKEMRKLLPVS